METQAKITWGVCGVLLVLAISYTIITARAFDILQRVDDRFERTKDSDEKDQLVATLRGGRAACVLSIIVMLAYTGYLFLLTLKKWFSEGVLNGVMLGVLLTASLYSSAFMLLTGVVLQANDLWVELNEGSDTERIFALAYYLAYTMTGVYIILFILHIFQNLQTISSSTFQANQ